MDLFDAAAPEYSMAPTDALATNATRADAPLAVRMRPRDISEVAGQRHLLQPGSPLRRLVASAAGGEGHAFAPSSIILWGPPGTGKTTLAYLISRSTDRHFVELSAVTAGVKEVRAVIEDARRRLVMGGKKTVLFIDEVHRFNKAQQDALLPAVENQIVTLIAATTENPSFSVNAPLLSRSLLLTLRSLTDTDITELVAAAVTDPRGLDGRVALEPEAAEQLVRMAGGDARKALTILEAAAAAAVGAPPISPQDGGEPRGPRAERNEVSTAGGEALITTDTIAQAIDVAAVRYDRDGDQHYDVISAFIKSIRGSDVDAALHYLARMVAAGEDPRFIARRLMVHASEDVGLADPMALQTAVAAAQATQLVGMPEARIILAQAVIYLATAAKSNAVVVAIDSALADVQSGRIGQVPAHLRDSHYPGAKGHGHGVAYRYPHSDPAGVVAQQYLPDTLLGAEYYRPTDRGYERRVAERLDHYRAVLNGRGGAPANPV